MNGRVSPFAALTSDEKQIKWLEVQSIRLPYVQGELEAQPQEPQPPVKPEEQQKPAPSKATERAEFQKTRHRQYDAVIARMKQAETRANGYRPIS